MSLNLGLQHSQFVGQANGLYDSPFIGLANGLTDSETHVRDGAQVFITQWNTALNTTGGSPAGSVRLPLFAGGKYDFTVDWGDGTKPQKIKSNTSPLVTHAYLRGGIYTVRITGTLIGWNFNGSGDRNKLLKVLQWGCVKLDNFTNATHFFANCENLDLSGVYDPLNCQGIIQFYNFFADQVGGSTFLSRVNRMNEWDVSQVTQFGGVFATDENFNEYIADWQTGSGTSMNGMFISCAAFNSPLNDWDVSKVTDVTGMFQNAITFNQPLSGWNTSKFGYLQNMFNGATAFDQDIGSWDMRSVIVLTDFMASKTPATFSAANLDAIYNGWIANPLPTSIGTSFGTAKYTAAGVEGRALLTNSNQTATIVDVFDNGSGLIRIYSGPTNLTTGNKVFISGVIGTVEANGLWVVDVIDTNTVDLQGSTFVNTYVSGGSMRTGYGWVITDGGI